jgi:N-acetyl-alpha-D-muramate 1-phosphate uridylyltransferase
VRQAVVLAGGLATRMLPLTEATPKILLPVAGRPFLSHLLDRLQASGFEQVVLAVGHLAIAVGEAAKREATARGLDIRLSEDGPRLLGTGGALRNALPLLEETFLVTYGDSYLPFDYGTPLEHLRARPSGRAAMAVFANHDAIEPSNVILAGGRVLRYEKQRSEGLTYDHIDYGATAIRRSEIEALAPDVPIGLDQVLGHLALSGGLLALPVRERFFEIGSPAGLTELERQLSEKVVPS